MTLYNCKHSGDQYRITKFNSDMNVESSYLCIESECECPRGPAPTCRHRQMLPKFLSREHVGDNWFFDFDRGGWVQMGEEWAEPSESFAIEGLDTSEEIKAELAQQPPAAKHIKRRL